MLGSLRGSLEGKVPIRIYLKSREFDAESIRVMGIALECARSALHVFPSDEVLSEAVAARIIELARTGEHDPEKLCDFAIAALKTPPALEREDI
jgi:hypothetical protein